MSTSDPPARPPDSLSGGSPPDPLAALDIDRGDRAEPPADQDDDRYSAPTGDAAAAADATAIARSVADTTPSAAPADPADPADAHSGQGLFRNPGDPLVGHTNGRAVLSVQPAARPADWIKIGFYFAVGGALLVLLALFLRFTLHAILDVVTPFVLGLVIALLLDPLVTRIEGWTRMPRAVAAIIVFVALLAIIGGILAVALPALVTQITNLVAHAPQYFDIIKQHVNEFLRHHRRIGSYKMPENFKAVTQQISARASGRATMLLQQSYGRVMGFLINSATALVELVLSLIIALFLLIDLKRLRARLMFLAPPAWRRPMKTLSGDVGGVFSDYVRGLLIVCSLFGVSQILLLYGLSIFHHTLAQYALLIGTLAGFLYAVPYVGSLSTSLLIFVIGTISGGALFGVEAVVGSVILNQIFDNIVTPKVVGGGVGLHPVVAMFALVLGGATLGLPGMLLSVPIAASIQVILFRIFPKTTAPTPPDFLTREGVRLDDAQSTKVRAGDKSPTKQKVSAR